MIACFDRWMAVCWMALFFLLLGSQTGRLLAQDDDMEALMGELEEEEIRYITGAFKSTRIVNLQSLEKQSAKMLQFIISHRFGRVDQGWYELWGIDNASIRFGLEYGINDWVTVGVGRSTYQKTYDGFVKASILRQSEGKKHMPLSLLYYGSIAINTLKREDITNPELRADGIAYDFPFANRLSYVHQLIIGRKFSERFSFQLAPTLIHRNLVETERDLNTMYAMGFGTRFKLSKRLALTAEYILRIPPLGMERGSPSYDNFSDSFSLGVDLETGGHVFQFHVTNSAPMVDKGFMVETREHFWDGAIHFGFNITRTFSMKGLFRRKPDQPGDKSDSNNAEPGQED